jgi:hypothetical protein
MTLITSIWLDPVGSRQNVLVNFAILSIVFKLGMIWQSCLALSFIMGIIHLQ